MQEGKPKTTLAEAMAALAAAVKQVIEAVVKAVTEFIEKRPDITAADLRLAGPITRQEFYAVKLSLRLLGKYRGYESVTAIAKMHGIGRSTAYRIKAAHSWPEYHGQRIPVKGRSVTHKVTVRFN